MKPNGAFPARGLGVQTFVVEESGRWVVYLDVAVESQQERTAPFEVLRRRIDDYASEREAEVAARFIGVGAGRELRRPPAGF